MAALLKLRNFSILIYCVIAGGFCKSSRDTKTRLSRKSGRRGDTDSSK
jgi:hypothetical protein